MLRKLVAVILLLPLPLNGLWMVCGDVRSIATQSPDPSAKPQDMAACTKMCPKEKPVTEGSVCLFTADTGNGSIMVVVFGVAVLPIEISVQPPVLREFDLPFVHPLELFARVGLSSPCGKSGAFHWQKSAPGEFPRGAE